jgi:hypothetical protein
VKDTNNDSSDEADYNHPYAEGQYEDYEGHEQRGGVDPENYSINPLEQIARNQMIIEWLSAFQNQNLQSNLNYSLNSQQHNNELLTLLLAQYLSGNPQALG